MGDSQAEIDQLKRNLLEIGRAQDSSGVADKENGPENNFVLTNKFECLAVGEKTEDAEKLSCDDDRLNNAPLVWQPFVTMND